MALAFNRMAGAIEDNFSARAEAADAQRKLEQSRELAEVVQIAHRGRARAHPRASFTTKTGQSMTAIRSLALSLARREGDATTRETSALIADTAAKLYAAMHALIPRLRPITLDNLDLAEAARERHRRMAARASRDHVRARGRHAAGRARRELHARRIPYSSGSRDERVAPRERESHRDPHRQRRKCARARRLR